MKISDCLHMSFSDLKKRRLRTILTALGISIGTMLIIFMAGFGQGIQKISYDKMRQFDSMKIIKVSPKTNSKNQKFKKIDSSTLDTLSKAKDVSMITAFINTSAGKVEIGDKSAEEVNVQGNNLDYSIFTDAEQSDVKSDKKKSKKYGYKPIIEGNTIYRDESASVLVNERLLEKMKIKDYAGIIGKNMKIIISLPNVAGIEQKQPLAINVKISGIVNKVYRNGKNDIIVSDATAAKIQEYYMNDSGYISKKGYDGVEVEADSISSIENVSNSIKKMGYSQDSQIQYAKQMDNMLEILKAIFMAAGVIVLLVASIGVINTMTMSVYEKKKSIGIMKAEGASKKDIRRIFTVESGSIGFIGGIFGAVISIILELIINKVVVMYNIAEIESGMKIIDIRVSVVVFAVLFTIAVSVISAFLPARKAAKLDPVESLRCE